MAGSPDRKIHFLGKEIDPGKMAIGGCLLALAGVWAADYPGPALLGLGVGLVLMGCGTHGMGEPPSTPPHSK